MITNFGIMLFLIVWKPANVPALKSDQTNQAIELISKANEKVLAAGLPSKLHKSMRSEWRYIHMMVI